MLAERYHTLAISNVSNWLLKVLSTTTVPTLSKKNKNKQKNPLQMSLRTFASVRETDKYQTWSDKVNAEDA